MERLRSSGPVLRPLIEPWALIEGGGPQGPADGLRAELGPLVAVRAGRRVRLARSVEDLPAHGPPVDAGDFGEAWQTYDLPASERREAEDLSLRVGREVEALRIGGQVPRPTDEARRSDTADTSTRLEAFIDSLVGVMLELRAHAEQFVGRSGSSRTQSVTLPLASEPESFEPTGRLPLACLPWQDAAKLLLARGSEPRMDVIVQIALEYREALERLAQSLRRTLRRERRMTAVGRVQQLDSACLEWFVRQPGRTAVEKAGVAQELLALVRTEDYDTLENRVFKDFLRAGHRCQQPVLAGASGTVRPEHPLPRGGGACRYLPAAAPGYSPCLRALPAGCTASQLRPAPRRGLPRTMAMVLETRASGTGDRQCLAMAAAALGGLRTSAGGLRMDHRSKGPQRVCRADAHGARSLDSRRAGCGMLAASVGLARPGVVGLRLPSARGRPDRASCRCAAEPVRCGPSCRRVVGRDRGRLTAAFPRGNGGQPAPCCLPLCPGNPAGGEAAARKPSQPGWKTAVKEWAEKWDRTLRQTVDGRKPPKPAEKRSPAKPKAGKARRG